MEIDQHSQDGISVFEPQGRIDTESADKIERALQATMAEGQHNMVMDMSRVDYISSAGLRILASAQVKNREQGGDLKMAGLNERVMRVFRIIGFDMFFSIHDTTESALADFSSGEKG